MYTKILRNHRYKSQNLVPNVEVKPSMFFFFFLFRFHFYIVPLLRRHLSFYFPNICLLTNSFFLHLYSSLLSQPINTNEVLPLLPICVSDLIMIATNPFSWATDRAHNKTSSQAPKTYDATPTY